MRGAAFIGLVALIACLQCPVLRDVVPAGPCRRLPCSVRQPDAPQPAFTVGASSGAPAPREQAACHRTPDVEVNAPRNDRRVTVAFRLPGPKAYPFTRLTGHRLTYTDAASLDCCKHAYRGTLYLPVFLNGPSRVYCAFAGTRLVLEQQRAQRHLSLSFRRAHILASLRSNGRTYP